MANNTGFSQRRPALFGILIAIAAMALVTGAMAFFGYSGFDEEGEGLLFTANERFGQVNITGEITSSEDIVAFIRELREDDTIKGVILRINSPGGLFGPSQEIFQAVKRLNEKKPVIASFSSVAASGGYYVSCPARVIYANPGTITGSIGVLSHYANFQELMGKLGVSYESFASGDLKDAGSPFKPLTPAQKAYIEALIKDLAEQFTSAVAESRKLSEKSLEIISDGRAMTGKRAQELGLVDVLGGREEALDALKKLCDLKGKIPVLKGPKPKENWFREITSALNLPDAGAISELTSLLRAARSPGLNF
jgi:protease IV